MSNSISDAYYWYKNHGPSPWLTAGLLGLGTYGLGRLAWGPLVETARSLGRPIATRLIGDSKNADAIYNQAVDSFKEDAGKKRLVPALLGAGTLAAALYLMYKPGAGLGSWREWDAPIAATHVPYSLNRNALPKTASFDDISYDGPLDWQKQISQTQAQNLFNTDPGIPNDARLTGLSIVNSAALNQHTTSPTLGGIFDSAVQKIDRKLSFGGLLETGARAVISNSAARLLTGALDTMVGLDPRTKQNIIDAGTWAGTVSSILG